MFFRNFFISQSYLMMIFKFYDISESYSFVKGIRFCENSNVLIPLKR